MADDQAEDVLIGELKKNAKARLRASLTRYRNHDLVDLRLCVEDDTAGKFDGPPGNGLSLRRELLPALRDVGVEAEQQAAKEAVESEA